MFVKWFRVGLKQSDELVKLCFQKRRCMEKQISQDRGSGGGASSTATGGGGGGASGHPVGQRRSNWEVIEHYTGVANTGQFSGAPTATSIHDFPPIHGDGDTSCGVPGGASQVTNCPYVIHTSFHYICIALKSNEVRNIEN